VKICFIADATSIHTQRWADYFMKEGHEIHLITYLGPKVLMPGVNLHVVSPKFNSLYLSFPFSHFRIRRIVKHLKPDIIHSHFITKFGFHGALLGFHPFFISAWGSDVLVIPYWSRILFYFTKFSLKKADIVYATSGDVEQKIISIFGVAAQKIRMIPFGVDTKLFVPTEKKATSDYTIVLSNRRFFPIYDLRTFVRAMQVSIEQDPNLRFILIGDGPEESAICSYINELGVSEYVSLVGEVENSEMPRYLQSSDIYVSTSLSDTTPVSVSEAMACELTCIVTNVGGVKEIISDGVNGFLIKPGDYETLAQKIVELSSNPQLRESIGTNARETIINKLDWWSLMEKVNQDYELFSDKR